MNLQTKSLWINYNRRGWRKKEPLDNELPSEAPRLIRPCFEVIAGKPVDSIRLPPSIAIGHHLIRTWALGEQ